MAERVLTDDDRETGSELAGAEPDAGPPAAERRRAECPRGLGGWVTALLTRRLNAGQNRLTVQALRVRPGEAVLEVGCGPGDALARVAQDTPAGFIAGVDHSGLMLRMAGRRNRTAITTGRLALRQADAAALPLPDGRFDAAFAVNSHHRWDDRAAGLREIRRALKPGGRLVLSIRILYEDRRWETAAQGRERAEAALVDLPRAGFRDLDAMEYQLDKRSVVLISGIA